MRTSEHENLISRNEIFVSENLIRGNEIFIP